jgi:transcriptional regulator with GAF, ATPase, and Fis domain
MAKAVESRGAADIARRLLQSSGQVMRYAVAHSFLQRGGNTRNRMSVQPEVMARLLAHDWPSNIRELRNVLDRARLFADDGIPDEFGNGP